MLLILFQIRRLGSVVVLGDGMRMPMLLTNNTRRLRATRLMSWISEWAWLIYHQSTPAIQTKAGVAFVMDCEFRFFISSNSRFPQGDVRLIGCRTLSTVVVLAANVSSELRLKTRLMCAPLVGAARISLRQLRVLGVP